MRAPIFRNPSVMGLGLLCSVALMVVPHAWANVQLPAILSDGMVLQCDMPIAIWGKAEPGEKISIKLGEAEVVAKADDKGCWQAKLPPLPAGGPYELTITGHNTMTLKDILIGEVWLCSGQSNMAFPLASFLYYDGVKEDLAAAEFPKIRVNPSSGARWMSCTPEAAAKFSATAFYFGRYLHRELKTPVGLIVRAAGSTCIEQWTPMEAIKETPWGMALIETQTSETFVTAKAEFAQRTKAYQEAKARWDQVKAAGKDTGPAPTRPRLPPLLAQYDRPPGNLFASNLDPLIPFTIRGVVWYQGEANVKDKAQADYLDKMKTMIGAWRKRWQQTTMPFYFVQLPPCSYATDRTVLPRFWDIQAAALSIPDTGMIGTLDLGDSPGNMHPPNKRELGRRLALLALAKTYNRKGIVYSGPMYKSMAIQERKIRVRFDHVGGGLVARDGKPLAWFQLAGTNRIFTEACADVDGDSVIVGADTIENPVAVRYAWHQTPGYTPGTNGPTGRAPNLTNAEDLPAFPFRTDAW